jgi:hypothetical protein
LDKKIKVEGYTITAGVEETRYGLEVKAQIVKVGGRL